MNMQALMKQAQAMQKDITNIKNEIDSATFEGRSSLVTVSVKGTKEVVSIKIDDTAKELIYDAFSKVDKKMSEKMGKYSSMMPGLM